MRKPITTVQREGQAPRPTKSGWDSADAKQTERSLKGKCGGVRQGGGCGFERVVEMAGVGMVGVGMVGRWDGDGFT